MPLKVSIKLKTVTIKYYLTVTYLLCILTSERMLRRLDLSQAGQNYLFQHFNISFSHKLKKEDKVVKRAVKAVAGLSVLKIKWLSYRGAPL